MADFRRTRKFTTSAATLRVDAGLPVGLHVFQLVVQDQAGNRSRPAQVTVRVTDAPGPFVRRIDSPVLGSPVVSPAVIRPR